MFRNYGAELKNLGWNNSLQGEINEEQSEEKVRYRMKKDVGKNAPKLMNYSDGSNTLMWETIKLKK